MPLKAVGGKYEGVWINELKNGNTTFYINFRDPNGKPCKKKVGVNTKQRRYTIKDAYDALIAVKHSLNTGQELPFQNQRKKKLTLNDIFLTYIEWQKSNGKKSWDTDEQRYRVHIQPKFGNKDMKNIKSAEIESFKQEKLKILSPQTVKHVLALFRLLFNYANKMDIITVQNPIEGGRVRIPKPDNAKLGFLTFEQAKKILDKLYQYPNPRLYQLSILLLFTGARFNEVVSLRWQNIDFQDNTIYFSETKNGNPRRIYMCARVKEVINQLLVEKISESDYIIKSTVDRKFSKMPKKWQKIVDDIIPGNISADKYRITVHSLRHTHASWLAHDGLDLMHLKEQLGHKTIQMTIRYSHLIPDRRHKAVIKISEELEKVES